MKAVAASARSKLIDPKVLMSIRHLELRARVVVEGFWSGLHRSPYHGFSVEFAEHRQYMPGDNIRDIDWKVFAKSDRYYIKQYEEETNLEAHLVIDASASMRPAANIVVLSAARNDAARKSGIQVHIA